MAGHERIWWAYCSFSLCHQSKQTSAIQPSKLWRKTYHFFSSICCSYLKISIGIGQNRDNIAVVTLQYRYDHARPGILGYRSQPKMGVANELIAVGWGYSGFANQPKFLFLSHLFHCYYYHPGGEGVTSYLQHSWMNLISDSNCQMFFGNVDNANTICVAYNGVGACAVRNDKF
jgi:hypothetical protein